jgi:O-methyltransferase involved in polyketide biosynthesis
MTLAEVSRTALYSFWARVKDAASASPILNDVYAIAIAPRVATLFGPIDVPATVAVGSCLRARTFDRFVSRVLAAPGPWTVVEIGGGLDCRYERLRPNVDRWIDVELPPLAAFRKTYMSLGMGDRRHESTSSADPDVWLRHVPRGGRLLVIVQGVLQYWTRHEVERLFGAIAEHAREAHVAFDSMAPPLRLVNNRAARHSGLHPSYTWAVWSTRLIRSPRFRFMPREEISFSDLPETAVLMPRPVLTMHSLPGLRRMYRMSVGTVVRTRPS